nr:MAG TPA: DNA-binding protein [Caudoviricetes sp.]
MASIVHALYCTCGDGCRPIARLNDMYNRPRREHAS